MDDYRKGHAKRFKSKNYDYSIWNCDYEYLDDEFIKVTGSYEVYDGGKKEFKGTFIFPVKSIELIVLERERIK